MKERSNGRRYRSAGEWRAIIKRQAESGLPVKRFCERESICAHGFFRWRKKLEAEIELAPTKFVELKPAAAADAIVRVELQLPNGAVLRIA